MTKIDMKNPCFPWSQKSMVICWPAPVPSLVRWFSQPHQAPFRWVISQLAMWTDYQVWHVLFVLCSVFQKRWCPHCYQEAFEGIGSWIWQTIITFFFLGGGGRLLFLFFSGVGGPYEYYFFYSFLVLSGIATNLVYGSFFVHWN